MSVSLTKRWIALALGLLMAAAAGAVAVSTIPSASAQEPASTTFVLSGIPVLATNGFATLARVLGRRRRCTRRCLHRREPARRLSQRSRAGHHRAPDGFNAHADSPVERNDDHRHCSRQLRARSDAGRQRHNRAAQASRYGGSVAREFIGDGRRELAEGTCPAARRTGVVLVDASEVDPVPLGRRALAAGDDPCRHQASTCSTEEPTMRRIRLLRAALFAAMAAAAAIATPAVIAGISASGLD